jgi:hypothetical protein
MFMKERGLHTLCRVDVIVGGPTYCDSHPSPSIRLVESTGQRTFRQFSGRMKANRQLDSR